jgi:molybdopterin converting factor small subunit
LIVKVLYFAVAQELAARKSESLSVPEGTSVGHLAGMILKAHPSLSGLRTSLRYSVNLTIAEGDVGLHEGDEVGVLPPVAGG